MEHTIVPFGDMHGDADTYYTIEGMDINQLMFMHTKYC